MVPTLDVPELVIPTPQGVAALVYPTLDELPSLLPDTSETSRFLAKLEVGPIPEHAPHLGPCLLWTSKPNSRGYGAFKTGHDSLYPGKFRTVMPHKWLDYFLHDMTPVPAGYELDHMCHDPNRCTVDPYTCPHRRCALHTWRRTQADNRMRMRTIMVYNSIKVRCDGKYSPRAADGTLIGDLLTDEFGNDTENVYRAPDGRRCCIPCDRRRKVAHEEKKKRLRAAAREHGLREAGYLELALS